MDVENPLHEDNIPIAKLVCIEVMGQIVDDLERESNNNNNNTISVEIACNEYIYKVFLNCSACLLSIICCFGFFIFLTGFPFAYY
jgi:hypothetical protein